MLALFLQGKARLGQVVHKKTATALALTVVKNEDQREFAKLVESVKQMYNDGPRVAWGGGIMGPKSQVWNKRKHSEVTRADWHAAADVHQFSYVYKDPAHCCTGQDPQAGEGDLARAGNACVGESPAEWASQLQHCRSGVVLCMRRLNAVNAQRVQLQVPMAEIPMQASQTSAGILFPILNFPLIILATFSFTPGIV
jgi:hypothetical protein